MKIIALGAAIAFAVPAVAIAPVVDGAHVTTESEKGSFRGGLAAWSGGGIAFVDLSGPVDDPARSLTAYGTFPAARPGGGPVAWADDDRIARSVVGAGAGRQRALTATAASEVLMFLADTAPDTRPPIALRQGIDLTADAPAPVAWALLFAGFGLVGGAVRRRAATVAA